MAVKDGGGGSIYIQRHPESVEQSVEKTMSFGWIRLMGHGDEAQGILPLEDLVVPVQPSSIGLY